MPSLAPRDFTSPGFIAYNCAMEKTLARSGSLALVVVISLAAAGCSSSNDGSDLEARRKAVARTEDQSILTDLATMDADPDIRREAVAKLVDPAVAARIAETDRDRWVRLAAVDKVNDQAVLARLALADADPGVRRSAGGKLTDADLQSRLADPVGRAMALGALRESDPLLARAAGNIEAAAEDARESIARLKMATQEPPVRRRFPGLRCRVEAEAISRGYVRDDGVNQTMKGERIAIALSRPDGFILAEAAWSTVFPERTLTADYFKGAPVSGSELLKTFFRQRAFAPEDLAELARSSWVEIRMAAAFDITDPGLISRLATTDPDRGVRQIAIKKIVDESALAEIARKDPDDSIRLEVVGRLTKNADLAHVAGKDGDVRIRLAAVLNPNLTDQELLARLALEDPAAGIRQAAVGKLTDQAVLAQVALGEKDDDIRVTAINKLTDPEALSRVAAGDLDTPARRHARRRLTELGSRKD